MKKVWVLCLTLSCLCHAQDAAPFAKPPSKQAAPAAPKAAPEAPPKPFIASLEIYGTTRLTEDALRAFLGDGITAWLQQGMDGSPEAPASQKALADRVKQKYGFAFVDWTVVQYFEPNAFPIHITLDVVEPADVARRMPFLAEPTGEFKDPDGLLRKWSEYEQLALQMVQRGELPPDIEDCVALHCPFGHKNAKLKPYEKIFVQGVKKNALKLIEIQEKDHRNDYRAFATYLLAYWKDNGKKVVDQMVGRIKDPDALVRNNVLRVLGDIAELHPELVVPHRPLMDALSFPRVSDRSKAVHALFILAQNSATVREDLLKNSVPTLIKLMLSHQPGQREVAHNVLKKISGKEFPVTDITAWTQWWTKASADAVAKKP